MLGFARFVGVTLPYYMAYNVTSNRMLGVVLSADYGLFVFLREHGAPFSVSVT